jgi:hypothetical protein
VVIVCEKHLVTTIPLFAAFSVYLVALRMA